MDLNLSLWPKQSIAFQSHATEILYGGAAGSAKSHLIRVAAIAWCSQIAGLQVYLFRRIREDLVKNHLEGPTGFRALLASGLEAGIEIIEDEIRFPNGSKIYLCHCKDEKDRFKYQGAEIHVLLIDELTHFTEVIYRFLRSRVRMPESMQIPDEHRQVFPRILCGSNPGGIGHQWVKTTWIDKLPPLSIETMDDSEGGFSRQFIPASLVDNPSINQSSYRANLSGLGNEALVKAMLEGDWDIVAGAALDISRDRHLIRPFKPPQHWTKFMSMDWGFVRPYSVNWFCVVEGGTLLEAKGNYPAVYLPDKSVVMYRELYGTTGKPDEGSREESPIVAKRIMQIELDAHERMDYRIADTQLWAKNDGPSMADRMADITKNEFNPRPAVKDRQAGYAEICNRLRGEVNDDKSYTPMLYITENCSNWWRTVPPLVLDDLHPEKGPDEGQEGHAYDSTVYGLISWPYVTTQTQRVERLFYDSRRKAKLTSTDPYRINKLKTK